MTSRTRLVRKQVDDVLGGDEMWAHADQTQGRIIFASGVKHLRIPFTASCDKCNHDRAYFYQLQIRSADEPMTTCMFFYPLFLNENNLPGIFVSLQVGRLLND